LHTKDGQPILQALRTAAFAEKVVVHESQIVPVPSDMPMDSASLIACGVITGYGAVVNTARVPAGSSVVVIGTGGVGLNSVQGAALSGATPLIAIDLLDNKLEAAKLLGASHGINATNGNVIEQVQVLTNGRGADYVFVTVGSEKAMHQGMALVRRAGTLVLVGMPASGVKLTIEAADFADASQNVMGSKMGSTRLRVDVPKLVSLYQGGRLKLDELVTKRYPLEEINEAVMAVKRGEALRNVIVF
jgi:Zn-dependent alcohol dehydrogenase